jgi:hypothetical protein
MHLRKLTTADTIGSGGGLPHARPLRRYLLPGD